MQKRLEKPRIMSSLAIQQVNEATIVLRHFVELSAKLLPLLNDLSKKEQLLPNEVYDRKRIIDVFHGYHFDTSTSKILMDSNVLDTIKNAFDCIEFRQPREDKEAEAALEEFLDEHDRLVDQWIQSETN